MNEYILITTTFNDSEVMNRIINILLSEKLVSCAQVSNIKSSYRWTGKIESNKEFLVNLKTRKSLFKRVEEKIKEYHNYEIPQIIAYDIVLGSKEYLNWIEEETK